jgi:acetyl esterase/lipase
VHDAFASYLWLIDPHNPVFGHQNPEALHEPFRPEDVIISGDSAGGGLCLALLNYINMYLRKPDGSLGVPLPGAGLLLSPWVDLSCSSKSYVENQHLDFLPARTGNLHSAISSSIQHPVYSYCFGSVADSTLASSKVAHASVSMKRTDSANVLGDETYIYADEQMNIETVNQFVRHPLVSPICGELKDLPPLLVQAGDAEMLRDETVAYAYKYWQANSNSHTSWIRHELYVDMPHVFQVINHLPSSKLAISQMNSFLNRVYSPLSRVHSSINLSAADSKLVKVVNYHLQCI